MPGRYLLTGDLDIDVVRRCLTDLSDRHEPLRSCFREVAGEPQQAAMSGLPALPLTVSDLRHLPAEQRSAAAERIADEAAATGFDLGQRPLWRADLLRTGDREHVLVLVMHHIVVDGSSLPLLLDEFAELYSAFALGRPARLDPLPARYADFIARQRREPTAAASTSLVEQWCEILAAAPPTLELPTDRPRPAAASYRGDRVEFEVPAELYDALGAVARRHRASIYIVMLAALNAVLARYSRQSTVVVGSPTAGRSQPEFERLVGFFVNTLAVATDLGDDPPFGILIERTRRATLAALDRQELPFERVVERLAPERSLAQHPVFQVLFALTRLPSVWEVPGLKIQALPPARNKTAKFDLSVLMYTGSGALGGAVEYAIDLFDRPTIERFTEHLLAVLAAGIDSQDTRCSKLAMVSPEERRWCLATGTGPPPTAGEGTIWERFQRQAAASPDAPALLTAGERLTYTELAERADRLAGVLRGLGVGPDALVAIHLQRGVAAAVAILGVLAAGGGYVPLDATHPTERLAAMRDDADPTVLVTDAADPADRRIGHLGPTLLVNGDGTVAGVTGYAGAAPPMRRRVTSADPHNLGYVMYTSGSTGRPKGVALPQRALVGLMDWHVRELMTGCRTLQFASIGFDVSLYEMLGGWLTGGAVVVATEDQRHDARELLTLLATERIEKAVLPVTVLQQLVEQLEHVEPPGRGGSHRVSDTGGIADRLRLREVITTGEALTITPQVRAFFDRHRGIRLHNHYGPAETHVVTAHRLPSDPDRWPARPPIGRPVAGVRTYVLDDGLLPAPIGVPGELYIGGECLARGYLNRPGHTAERFIPDPVSGIPGARLYRTGDRCRLRADGELEYLGRLDHQLKIRGVRVEPGEVEAALASHRWVRTAAVVPWESAGIDQLIAYVVPDLPDPPDPSASGEAIVDLPDALRVHVSRLLPPQMVPSVIGVLDELPLNANGKVDRHRLPEPESIATRPRTDLVAPTTEAERRMADIWSDVLGVRDIGRQSDFFELGGHSLLAMRVVSRARAAFGQGVAVSQLFAHPTLETFAAAVEKPTGSPDPGPIRPRASVGPEAKDHGGE